MPGVVAGWAFMPEGRAPKVGEHFRFPDAAHAAPHRRDQGPRLLLRSELAERIAAFSKECGGAMTLEDLRGYRPEWVKPISRSIAATSCTKSRRTGGASPR